MNGINGKEQDVKFLKIIAVSLKEAALDSPSFRANVNYFHMQIENIENWVNNTTEFTKVKYQDSLSEFKHISLSLLEYAIPPTQYLNSPIIEDQWHTPLLLNACKKGLEEIHRKLLQILQLNPDSYLSVLLEIMTVAVDPYKACRKNFEYYQAKYDKVLIEYQSIKRSDNLDPLVIKEDAFQLFECRKCYLEAALDLILAISDCKMKLDSLFFQLTECLRPPNQDEFAKVKTEYINEWRIKYSYNAKWHQERLKIYKMFLPEIEKTKQHIKIFASEQLKPTMNIDDYNIGKIAAKSFLPPLSTTDISEKSGWLFIKTTVSTPPRTIWIKRWFFVKSFIFGMHLLCPAKTSVEETDKFGILLVEPSHAFNEERKFCFKVTIHNNSYGKNVEANNEKISIILQADNSRDFEEWLAALYISRKKVLSLDGNNPDYLRASRRYPPTFIEFACSSKTKVDEQLTTISSLDSKSLVQLIHATYADNDFGIFNEPYVRAPITTSLTKLAVTANAFIEQDGVPNAITSNFWGSVNWNDHFIVSKLGFRTSDKEESALYSTPSTSPIWEPAVFPDYYPEQLRNETIAFRSIFSKNLSSRPQYHNLVLDSISCIWSPNEKQEFWGVAYITMDYIYFYMNIADFVCLFKRSFDKMASVELIKTKPSSNTDEGIIKMYFMNDAPIKIKIYFTKATTVVKKLQLILDNNVAANPLSLHGVLDQLQQVQEKDSNDFNLDLSNIISQKSSQNLPKELFHYLSIDSSDLLQRWKKLQLEYTSVYHINFDIPAKGLMHLLFGDRSMAFPTIFLLSKGNKNKHIISPWVTSNNDDDTSLRRVVSFKLDIPKRFISLSKSNGGATVESSTYFTTTQRIVKVCDELYYEVSQESCILYIPFTKPFKLYVKFVIMDQNITHSEIGTLSSKKPTKSVLHIYYQLRFLDSKTNKPVTNLNCIDYFVSNVTMQFCQLESLHIKQTLSSYVESLGTHGKVIKAIRTCGYIGIRNSSNNSNSDNSKIDESIVKFSKTFLLKLIFNSLLRSTVKYLFSIIRILFQASRNLLKNILLINRIVIFALILSSLANIYLFSRVAVPYSQKAETSFDQCPSSDCTLSERTISMNELDLLSSSLINEKSECFKNFMSSSDYANTKWRVSKHRLDVTRNQILVDLKVLSSLEKQLVSQNYQEFLLKELHQCSIVETEFKDVWKADKKLQNYCSICENELTTLHSVLESIS
ncbi:Sip3p Ecym_1123 [Eremothecium cymbalariae DBVPG|uniref:PH domain-containing protein n=1 Tax=Eremothecium cymbalariae (strain CBS 270.75 / DBVPG 7215 / KCTC 17166 / NRRL Y-17582) TaxID=931890 RepID=G8JMM2_ERECY|nr:hypothetical protein Ecym_1123 [Eremothecium cymbalariae DBVPG\